MNRKKHPQNRVSVQVVHFLIACLDEFIRQGHDPIGTAAWKYLEQQFALVNGNRKPTRNDVREAIFQRTGYDSKIKDTKPNRIIKYYMQLHPDYQDVDIARILVKLFPKAGNKEFRPRASTYERIRRSIEICPLTPQQLESIAEEITAQALQGGQVSFVSVL